MNLRSNSRHPSRSSTRMDRRDTLQVTASYMPVDQRRKRRVRFSGQMENNTGTEQKIASKRQQKNSLYSGNQCQEKQQQIQTHETWFEASAHICCTEKQPSHPHLPTYPLKNEPYHNKKSWQRLNMPTSVEIKSGTNGCGSSITMMPKVEPCQQAEHGKEVHNIQVGEAIGKAGKAVHEVRNLLIYLSFNLPSS